MAPQTRSQAALEDDTLIPLIENTTSNLKSRNPTTKTTPKGSDIPPVHTIDLSLAPEQRYVSLALAYKSQIKDLIGLFDEVISTSPLKLSISTVKSLARLLLRKVHDDEQTRELRGISDAAGVEMYLMVAFNVLLDLYMGCTSGGVKVQENGQDKMVHFRTMDWGMDVLRKVVVQLEFVEREDGPVVARSITYVGFVGVLTGVRENLSVSLNFRGLHNDSGSRWSNFLFYKHLLAVLLGFQPSIASILRQIILPSAPPSRRQFWRKAIKLPALATVQKTFPSLCTTSCYLIFSNGRETTTIEKDRITGLIRSSSSFITATNHDADTGIRSNDATAHIPPQVTGMEDIVDESMTRKQCVQGCYDTAIKNSVNGSVSIEDVEGWLGTYPVLNECTHYAVLMDPEKGEIRYARRWVKPFKPGKDVRSLYASPWHA